MSEYWLSHKKYFCKYCDIYITDDEPSRRQHEGGLRHKGNRERFVRNLYKQGERRKKDLEEERRELARVEVAANAAFAQDVSAGHASLPSSSSQALQTPSTAATSKKPERSNSVWSNYTTAQSLGITDPDEERLKAEIERRKTQGVVGEWEVVAPPPPPLSEDLRDPKEEDTKDGVLVGSPPQKREAEAPFEDEDGRRFKWRKRTIVVGLGEIWDPGDIPIKLKSREKEGSIAVLAAEDKHDRGHAGNSEARQKAQGSDVDMSESLTISEQTPHSSNDDKPKWQPMRWKRVTDPTDDKQTGTNEETDEQKNSNDADPSFMKKDRPAHLHRDAPSFRQSENETKPKVEPSSSDDGGTAKPIAKAEGFTPQLTPDPAGGLFRKRKVPAAARGRRG